MKYHSFRGNNREMGNLYPVTEGMCEGYNYDAPNSYSKLEFGKTPDLAPDLDGIIVSPNAILTDYISTRTPNPLYGMLISSALANHIKPFVEGFHSLFPATVVSRGKPFDYFWLHFGFNAKPFIDFKNSSFSFTTFGGRWLEDVGISSYEEYLLLNKQFATKKTIDGNLIKLNIAEERLPHVFSIGIGGRYIVVSSELAFSLTKNGFTGLLFGSADWLKVTSS